MRGLYNCEIRLRDNLLTLLRCPELTRGGQLSGELSLRYAKAKVSAPGPPHSLPRNWGTVQVHLARGRILGLGSRGSNDTARLRDHSWPLHAVKKSLMSAEISVKTVLNKRPQKRAVDDLKEVIQ